MEKKILVFLAKNQGVTARTIAAGIGCGTSEVNSVLYRMKNEGRAKITSAYRWTLATHAPLAAAAKTAERSSANGAAAVFPSPEQASVVAAPVTARIAVEAGPGTGKTETLAGRLRHLIGQGRLSASNILVLSFSVAAVKELKSRVEKTPAGPGASAAYVEIRTFDSFASRLLRSVLGAAALAGMGYDDRIIRATKEISTNPEALKVLRAFKHVLLDELQDLVGVRADFAHALLATLKPAFTMFGDSAQGIYDFQIQGGPSRTTSGDLMGTIRKAFPDLGPPVCFTTNFRVGANSRLLDISLRGRALLLESPEKARLFLEKEFSALAGLGSTAAPKIEEGLLREATCVVCRTNGQVLRLAGELNKKGVPFRMARDRNQYLAPAWIGAVFFGWPDERVRKQAFLAKACAQLAIQEARALELWNGLVAAFAEPGAIAFGIGDLRSALVEGTVLPDFGLFPPAADVIELSTIHRSKGREFMNVIVVMEPDGEDARGKEEDSMSKASEPRVLFVALTRAKSGLRRMEAATRGVWMPKERWIRSFGSKGDFKKLNSIQVGLARDVDGASFVAGSKAAAAQGMLLEKCRPGTPVELVLDGREGGCPIYRIKSGGRDVGRMSKEFGWAVWHTLDDLNGKPRSFPKSIQNLWVREVTTVVGDLSDERVDRPLRTSGLWLGLELEGLGYCNWHE